jgi:hypothetical protein
VTRSRAPSDARNRRRFLKGLGALSVVGLAGCGGDDDTPAETTAPGGTTEATETTEPAETTESTETAETAGTTEPAETTEPGETTASPTTDPGDTIPDENPETLLSFDDTPMIDAGKTTAISGTVTNPYLFDLVDIDITMEAPNDDWEITAVGGTMIDGLEAGGSREAEWEVSAPESASGAFDMTVTVAYASSTDETETSFEQPISVVTPPSVSTESVSIADLGDRFQHAYAVQGSDQLTDEPAIVLEPSSDDDGWLAEAEPADVYFAYDDEAFYYRIEIVQQEVVTVAGPNMYQADSAFFGTAQSPTGSYPSDRGSPVDVWGPEYNMRHAPDFDSNIELVQYQGGGNAPLDHTDMTASSTRDEENNLTTFDLEIPWDALSAEPPEAGDTFPWGISASDNEEVDGEIQDLGGWGFGGGAFGWPKFPEELARVTLQDDSAAPYQPDPRPDGPDQIGGSETGTWTITVVNWHDSPQEIEYDIQGTGTSGTLNVDAESAIQLEIEWLLVDSTDLRVEFDNGKQVWASEKPVTVG